MRCEHTDTFDGFRCRARALWQVGIGTRQTDAQLSCGSHLSKTCKAMLAAENRNATLTITPAPEQEEQ
jgi:hypothetical protein